MFAFVTNITHSWILHLALGLVAKKRDTHELSYLYPGGRVTEAPLLSKAFTMPLLPAMIA